MDEPRSYCGQPVTRCAKIIASIGAIISAFALAGAINTNPPTAITIFFTFMFYMLTLVGLRKEHPTWILISSIIMLIYAVVNTVFAILFIYAAIALPEYIVEPFKHGRATEEEARKMARILCFAFAFANFLEACFTTFGYKVFSAARKYYLQRGSYISPSILEDA